MSDEKNVAQAQPVAAKPAAPASREFGQKIVQRIAKKFATDIGLTEDDYDIVYVETQHKPKGSYTIGGAKPRIIFPMLPNQPEFEFYLRRALQNVRDVKRSKALVPISQIHGETAWVTQLFQETEKKLLPAGEYTTEVIRKVVLTHKKTGLTSVQECREGDLTWSRMAWLGRIELSQLVKLTEKLETSHQAKLEDAGISGAPVMEATDAPKSEG